MGVPSDKFARTFEAGLANLERLSTYSRAQYEFGWPVADLSIVEKLEEMYTTMLSIKSGEFIPNPPTKNG